MLRSIWFVSLVVLSSLIASACSSGTSTAPAGASASSAAVTGNVLGNSFSANTAYAFTQPNSQISIAFPPTGSSFSCANLITTPSAVTVVASNAVGTYPISATTDANQEAPAGHFIGGFFNQANGSQPTYGDAGSLQLNSVSGSIVSGTVALSISANPSSSGISGAFTAVICK